MKTPPATPLALPVRSFRRTDLTIYLGVAFATTLGHTAITSLPFEVGAITDGLRLDAAQTGSLATAELAAYALTNLLIAPYVSRVSTRGVSVAGALLVIVASLATGCTTNLPPFAMWRVLAGIGFGVIFASANVAGSLVALPERAYAIGLGVSIVFFSVLPSVFAKASTLPSLFPGVLQEHSGVFVAVAAFAALMLPTMWFLPAAPAKTASAARLMRAAVDPSDRLNLPRAGAAMLVMALWSLGGFSLYTFIERRAHLLGMSAGEIGLLLSVSIGIGMTGTVSAACLGSRIGIALPSAAGLLAQGASCLAVALSAGHAQFYVSTIVFMTAWYFVFPYVLGLGARVDPQGRIATAVGGMYLVGSSVAATVGGVIVKFGGYSMVGWVACGLCAGAAVTAFILARALDGAANSTGAELRTLV